MRAVMFVILVLSTLSVRAGEYIAVNASGWVEAVPDTLTSTAMVRATGTDVTDLQGKVDATTQKIVTAARELGVDKSDIDTARVSVRPEYQWRDGQRIYRGQTVERSITITLRELDIYGALIAALSRYDIDDLGQPVLSHSEIEELKLKALDHALQRGFDKAKRIARGIDARLGDVIRVEEQGTSLPPPMTRMLAAEAHAGGAPEIQFGKQRITASVTMRFAIN